MIRDQKLQQVQAGLQYNHKLATKFLSMAGGGERCFLSDIHTGTVLFRGMGMSCEEAFRDAVSQFEAQDDPRDVAGENARLREQLKSMESQLEDKPAAEVEEEKSTANATAAPDQEEATVKKRRGRPPKKKLPADFDLPTDTTED
tara:strand:+ start:1284 stop:1718 length:435 start_codon:yes stop_codon:yes gene_type:complete